MDEMMAFLKEITKIRDKILQDLMQQMSMLGSKVDSMSVGLEPRENLWVSPIYDTPAGSTSNPNQPLYLWVARLEFTRFDEIDHSG